MNDYKLLYLNELVLPIPTWAKWITWDDEGCFLWNKKPKFESRFLGETWAHDGKHRAWQELYVPMDYSDNYYPEPPEPGPFEEQIYKLEDL